MPKKELQNGILFQAENMFVIRDGKRIAKRNQQTKTWIPLEPGWQVFDADDGPDENVRARCRLIDSSPNLPHSRQPRALAPLTRADCSIYQDSPAVA
jgi:hypothetical protein